MIRMNRKGSELSMNVIIIAAIALLVLVILAVMLLQKGGDIQEGTSCTGLGGECCSSCGNACVVGGQKYSVPHPTGECPSGQQCCLKLGDGDTNR
ncbi:MAG: DUF948 domain-containing protein [Nanobdellota archaeon]